MTNKINVYLDDAAVAALKLKALDVNIEGRGWLSNYLRKLAHCDIAFLDINVRKILRSLELR